MSKGWHALAQREHGFEDLDTIYDFSTLEEVNTMPVPNEVNFGPRSSGGKYDYGEVRALPLDEQIDALKLRLDEWLLKQGNELVKTDSQGDRVVYAPFPLAVLTCIAIETIGQIIYGDMSGDSDRRSEPFRSVLKDMDAQLSQTLSQDAKNRFAELWGGEYDRKKAKDSRPHHLRLLPKHVGT